MWRRPSHRSPRACPSVAQLAKAGSRSFDTRPNDYSEAGCSFTKAGCGPGSISPVSGLTCVRGGVGAIDAVKLPVASPPPARRAQRLAVEARRHRVVHRVQARLDRRHVPYEERLACGRKRSQGPRVDERRFAAAGRIDFLGLYRRAGGDPARACVHDPNRSLAGRTVWGRCSCSRRSRASPPCWGSCARRRCARPT